MHGFLLLELFNQSLSILSFELPLLSLLLTFALFGVQSGLLGGLLLGSKCGSLLFLLLSFVVNLIVIFRTIIDKIIIGVGIFANDLVLEHLLEGLDVLLEEFGHFLDSEGGDVRSVLDAFDGELFKFKHIIVLELKFVQSDGVELNSPGYFFLGFSDVGFIAIE